MGPAEGIRYGIASNQPFIPTPHHTSTATAVMTSDANEWVLVTKKSSRRRGARRDGAQRSQVNAHGRPRPLQMVGAADVIDRNARVSAAKQDAIQKRVGRIETLLMKQGLVDLVASMVTTQLAIPAATHGDEHKLVATANKELEIVNYGLGSFCASTNALYQLAFASAMAKTISALCPGIKISMEIYDPVMNASDREIAAYVGIMAIDANECGKRLVKRKTVFFMPHCGKTLYQNTIRTNWGPRLSDAIIIGNSFEAYNDRLIDADARRSSLLIGLRSFLIETPVPMTRFKSHEDYSLFESAFNDLSIHVFPRSLLEQALVDESLITLVEKLATAEDDQVQDEELITAS